MTLGLWVGGLVAFLFVPDRRFGRYAAVTLGIAAASGLVLAFAHTGLGGSLVTTDYGRVLVLKVVFVGVAVLAVLSRRHRLELGMVTVAAALAAVLMALHPPL